MVEYWIRRSKQAGSQRPSLAEVGCFRFSLHAHDSDAGDLALGVEAERKGWLHRRVARPASLGQCLVVYRAFCMYFSADRRRPIRVEVRRHASTASSVNWAPEMAVYANGRAEALKPSCVCTPASGVGSASPALILAIRQRNGHRGPTRKGTKHTLVRICPKYHIAG